MVKKVKLEFDKELLKKVRETMPDLIAKDIINVQPISNVNWNAIAESKIFQSFAKRHFNKEID